MRIYSPQCNCGDLKVYINGSWGRSCLCVLSYFSLYPFILSPVYNIVVRRSTILSDLSNIWTQNESKSTLSARMVAKINTGAPEIVQRVAKPYMTRSCVQTNLHGHNLCFHIRAWHQHSVLDPYSMRNVRTPFRGTRTHEHTPNVRMSS